MKTRQYLFCQIKDTLQPTLLLGGNCTAKMFNMNISTGESGLCFSLYYRKSFVLGSEKFC